MSCKSIVKKLSSKKIKELLKSLQKKPTKLNCVATEKCQINFEQEDRR